MTGFELQSHDEARCVKCGRTVKMLEEKQRPELKLSGRVSGRGKWVLVCPVDDARTYYDLRSEQLNEPLHPIHRPSTWLDETE